MNCTVYHYIRTVMLCWNLLQAEIACIPSYMLHRTRKDIHYGRNVFLATYEKPSGFETLMTIFIYCSWVSTRWQRSVSWYKNRKEAAVYRRETIHKTIQINRILQKIANKPTKQKQTLKNIKKHKSSN